MQKESVQDVKEEEEKSVFYQLCCKMQRFTESIDTTTDSELVKAHKELI